MVEPDWQIEGEYFETCNCEFLCPCLYTNLAATPTHGDCKVAMVYHIRSGAFGTTRLDGLSFIVAAYTPGAMGEGNWTVGLIVDEKASDDQHDAITAIATGKAGGPMAMLTPLIGVFAGVERSPIHIEREGLGRRVSVPNRLEEGLTAMPTYADPSEAIVIDNTAHPANSRLALAKATHSHLHAFGIDFDDVSARNNAHFAPFTWRPR